MMMTSISTDDQRSILNHLNAVDLVKASRTCKEVHTIAREVMSHCDLSHLVNVMNQQELCKALCLKPDEARVLPHDVEVKTAFMFRNVTHTFYVDEILDVLLVNLGGWSGLATRIHRRDALKRKREDLSERRQGAIDKRQALVDQWIVEKKPFGPHIQSFDAWTKSLQVREARSIEFVPVLAHFFSSDTLKSKPLNVVTEVMIEHERIEEIAFEKRTSARAIIAARKEEVIRLLHAQGRELDNTNRFVTTPTIGWWTGVSPDGKGFPLSETAECVANEIVSHQIAVKAQQERVEKQKAEEKAQHEAEKLRRAQLRKELRKLGFKTVVEADVYHRFAKDGRTECGITDCKEVAKLIHGRMTRRDAIREALVAKNLMADFYHELVTDFIMSRGDVDVKESAVEVAKQLEVRVQEKSVEKEHKQNERKRVRDQIKRAKTASSSFSRTCSSDGCHNLHRIADPAIGQNGPICGACDRNR